MSAEQRSGLREEMKITNPHPNVLQIRSRIDDGYSTDIKFTAFRVLSRSKTMAHKTKPRKYACVLSR